MAPTKKDAKEEKEAKLTPEQSAAMMLDYLRKQNRPYSATDISTNLKNRVTKTAAAKLLKDMHERKDIEGRAAGKQIVYHAIQEEPDDASLEMLKTMDEQTTRLRDEINELKNEEKELRVALREGSTQIPLPELKAAVAVLERNQNEMEARFQILQKGDLKPISIEEREKVNAEHRKWQRTANARMKIRNEMWKEIVSNIEKGQVEETKEELGLDF
ncbi:Hypothetical protein R9X50_00700800 [Acrodontium crateriforme]|uniref:Homologous-pairing protein 2 winged helix domain-containing protein n=1 Tax=Acrodontium crateriforme TaxID=150365 RepID=A0AAQ3RDX5_9PEZI|nr:Hypothetical protein R9X50_00700800 [Acrodontium crateriforme]